MQPILSFAPLHGITNRTFRNAYFKHFSGFDSVVAPFILSVNTSGIKKNHFKDIIPKEDIGIPLVPQILSNDPTGFVATAALLTEAGYDEVNWNMGCPYSMVAKKKRGSGLLPHPDLVAGILDHVAPQLKTALSVKVRLGMNDPAEILKLMPILNRYPLKKVIIHPRIGVQMYKGDVDLDGFARAADLCKHEVVYNGDIRNLAGFETLRQRFPRIREWMIGRGAIHDPLLASRIRGEPEPTDGVTKIRAFHADLYGNYRTILFGPAHVLDKMKEVWQYLGDSFPTKRRELEKISQCHTLEAYERLTGIVLS